MHIASGVSGVCLCVCVRPMNNDSANDGQIGCPDQRHRLGQWSVSFLIPFYAACVLHIGSPTACRPAECSTSGADADDESHVDGERQEQWFKPIYSLCDRSGKISDAMDVLNASFATCTRTQPRTMPDPAIPERRSETNKTDQWTVLHVANEQHIATKLTAAGRSSHPTSCIYVCARLHSSTSDVRHVRRAPLAE